HIGRAVEIVPWDAGTVVCGSGSTLAGRTAGRRSRRRRCRDGNCLRLSAHGHDDVTIGIELDDHVRALIHNPDVILRIHTDRMGKNEPIQTLADLTDILPRLIELKETCRGTYEYLIVSQCRIDG